MTQALYSAYMTLGEVFGRGFVYLILHPATGLLVTALGFLLVAKVVEAETR